MPPVGWLVGYVSSLFVAFKEVVDTKEESHFWFTNIEFILILLRCCAAFFTQLYLFIYLFI